jgi:hypothetical protein
MSHAKDAEDEDRSPKIWVNVVSANRYAFETEVVTGRQIKEKWHRAMTKKRISNEGNPTSRV